MRTVGAFNALKFFAAQGRSRISVPRRRYFELVALAGMFLQVSASHTIDSLTVCVRNMYDGDDYVNCMQIG